MGDSTCRRFRNRDGSAIAGISPSFGRCSVQIHIEEIGGNASPYAGNRPVFLKERDQLVAAHASIRFLELARKNTVLAKYLSVSVRTGFLASTTSQPRVL